MGWIRGSIIRWVFRDIRSNTMRRYLMTIAGSVCRGFMAGVGGGEGVVRWGVADVTMNNYFSIEKVRHPFLLNAQFTKSKHEYFPVPQEQIVFTNGLYTQNKGY